MYKLLGGKFCITLRAVITKYGLRDNKRSPQ
jgi:hypothetical protein